MFQKTSSVGENMLAVLTVELSNGASFECLLDTGFQGTLIVPRKFAKENSLPLKGSITFSGAENVPVEFDSSIAEVNWLGEIFTLPVLVSQSDEALIGVEMFVDCELNISYINSIVTITKPK